MSADFLRFKGISNYGEVQHSTQLEVNLVGFVQWAFLGLGAFANVERAASGVYGGDASRLRLSEDPNYTTGQVWEGFRRDWVWETGIGLAQEPIHVSGVWTDGVFQPTSGVGPYAHTVDYPNGRIIFQSPISTSGVVQASYSYRAVHASTADVPWWREVQTYSLRVDNERFLETGSGEWSVLSQNRVQLPAIVIEAVPATQQGQLALGGGVRFRQEVRFNILAETPYERKHLHDILVNQWQKRVNLFDVNQVMQSGVFPLDADGSPNGSGLMYPDLVSYGGYGWRQLRVERVASEEISSEKVPGLYPASVSWICEVNRA